MSKDSLNFPNRIVINEELDKTWAVLANFSNYITSGRILIDDTNYKVPLRFKVIKRLNE